MRTVFFIVLAVIVLILAYMVYRSIKTPIEYEKIKKERGELVINKLKIIRNAERAFKSTNGKFTTDLDSLADFIENGYIKLIKKEGILTDEMLEAGITEKEAVRKGLIKRDTIKVPVKNTHFKDLELDLSKLKYIPGTQTPFDVSAAEIAPTSSSTLKVQVIEIKAPIKAVLSDIIDEYDEPHRTDIAEYKRLNKYPGWKIGSLEEANDMAGTWE